MNEITSTYIFPALANFSDELLMTGSVADVLDLLVERCNELEFEVDGNAEEVLPVFAALSAYAILALVKVERPQTTLNVVLEAAEVMQRKFADENIYEMLAEANPQALILSFSVDFIKAFNYLQLALILEREGRQAPLLQEYLSDMTAVSMLMLYCCARFQPQE